MLRTFRAAIFNIAYNQLVVWQDKHWGQENILYQWLYPQVMFTQALFIMVETNCAAFNLLVWFVRV